MDGTNNPIRLSFGIKYEHNLSSGKHKFANRLVCSIRENFSDRITIVDRVSPADIHITFDGKCKTGCKNIYRIDGVWINTIDKDLEAKNDSIVNGLKTAKAIIFQSEFCEQAVKKYLGISPKRSTIIYNGADPEEFSPNPKHKPDKPSFIAMCKWRPHKRFQDIAEGFLKSNCRDKCYLHVFGEVEKKTLHPSIIYHGWSQDSHKILPWCMASVHISYLDWCPNAVVESLVAGIPVIYANSGGTPYLVRENGFRIKDKGWGFSPIDLYGNHRVDINELASAYDQAYEHSLKQESFTRPDLYIDKIAEKYVNYVEYIMKKK